MDKESPLRPLFLSPALLSNTIFLPLNFIASIALHRPPFLAPPQIARDYPRDYSRSPKGPWKESWPLRRLILAANKPDTLFLPSAVHTYIQRRRAGQRCFNKATFPKPFPFFARFFCPEYSWRIRRRRRCRCCYAGEYWALWYYVV